jgi:hypothetical protein
MKLQKFVVVLEEMFEGGDCTGRGGRMELVEVTRSST